MTKKQLALKYTRQCAYQKENADRIKARKLRKRINDPAKYMLDTKRRTCKVIGVEFSLSASDITPLPSVCPVLGIKLDYAICSGKKGPRDNSPSIDRILPRVGYVSGNVQIISVRANRIKTDATPEELKKVADYMQRITCQS